MVRGISSKQSSSFGKRFVPVLEALESKIVPAGNVSAYIRGDILFLYGDNNANQISIVPNGSNGVDIVALDDSTTINRQSTDTGSITITGRKDIRHIRADLRGGDDVLAIADFTLAHDFDIRMGTGNDQLTVDNVNVQRKLSTISTSSGNDFVQINASSFVKLNLNMGSGDDITNVVDSYFGKRSRLDGSTGTDSIGIVNTQFGDNARVEGYGIKTPNVLAFARNDTATVGLGGSVTIDLVGNDIGSIDVGSIVITSLPVNGDVVVNGDGTVTYNNDGSGFRDSFRYTVTNESGQVTNEATVNIAISDVVIQNPIATNDVATVALGSNITLNVAANDSALTGSLNLGSIAIVQQPTRGSIVVNGDGTVTYTNNGVTAASDSFRYTIQDDSGNISNAALVTITLVNAPTGPVANNDATTLVLGGSTTVNVAANDTVASGTLNLGSIIITQPPTRGTVVANSNGTIFYTSNGTTGATDTLQYTINDSNGNVSNAATVTFTLTTNPNAPLAANDTGTVSSGGSVTVSVLNNDTDAQNNINATSVAVVQQSTSGTLTVNADGTVTYQHNGVSLATSDTFTYRVSDFSGLVSNIATVTLGIQGSSNPVAVNDSATVSVNGTVIINVLGNDSDPQNNINPSTVTITQQPTSGTVVVNANGSVSYTRNGSFTPTLDTFLYTVTDFTGFTSNAATVSVTLV
jgi:hypothetical protein